MGMLALRQVTRRYDRTVAVDDLTLDVAAGSFVSLLGPSGCGKSTTLRMIAGFVQPSSGRIELDGKRIDTVPAHDRDIGMVFQNYALFPHRTASGNVGFGLEMRHLPRKAITERVRAALAMVGLESLGERFPSQLSGGQQQRVALARALVIEPRLLLLDEPLSNLDARLRAELREEIARLSRRLRITTVFVTHDQEEALALSDRIVVMERGRAIEEADPETLSERPLRRFTAGFLGARTVLPGRAKDGSFVAGALRVPLAEADPHEPTHAVLRASRLLLLKADAVDRAAVQTRVKVLSRSFTGDRCQFEVEAETGELIRVIRPSEERLPAPGEAALLAAGRDAITLIHDPEPSP